MAYIRDRPLFFSSISSSWNRTDTHLVVLSRSAAPTECCCCGGSSGDTEFLVGGPSANRNPAWSSPPQNPAIGPRLQQRHKHTPQISGHPLPLSLPPSPPSLTARRQVADLEAVVPLSLCRHPAQVQRRVPGEDGDVGRRNCRDECERVKTDSMTGSLKRERRCDLTSVQQGGAAARDGRSVSGDGASAHFEDIMTVGVQWVQLNVVHAGVANELHPQEAVSARHLCSRQHRPVAGDGNQY